MDTSNPAVFVNGELLARYVGRKVRTVIQVMRNDGAAVHGRSTDEKQLVVKGSPPSALTTFVEVIGIADGQNSICADIWTNFGDNFGSVTNQYNSGCFDLDLRNGAAMELDWQNKGSKSIRMQPMDPMSIISKRRLQVNQPCDVTYVPDTGDILTKVNCPAFICHIFKYIGCSMRDFQISPTCEIPP